MSICSFLGERPKDFPWKYGNNPKAHTELIRQLKEAIEETVEFDEITTFCCGLAHGADWDFAEAVLYLKENKYPQIKLICVVDKEYPRKDWSNQDAERYQAILERADEKRQFGDISPIAESEQIVAAWNGNEFGTLWNTLCCAMQNSIPIRFVRLNDIKTDTDEPDGRLKRQLHEAEETSKRSVFARIAYTLVITELIKQHPDAKGAFKTAIKNNPAFKQEIAKLAQSLEVDLSENQ